MVYCTAYPNVFDLNFSFSVDLSIFSFVITFNPFCLTFVVQSLSLFVCVCLCSQKGLKNVFDEAILAALEPPEPKKKRKCVML